MIAADTNVVVRHLTHDDRAQTAVAGHAGASTTLTFDRRLARASGFTLAR